MASQPSRRDLAALLLCAAPVAVLAEQTESASPDNPEAELRKSLDAVSKFDVPIGTEPMFAFRVY